MEPCCPFCHHEISPQLERFGGPCPHCFADIPGDDAATDPGLEKQAEIQREDQETAKRSRRREVALVGAVVALSAIFAVIGLWPSPNVEPIDFGDDDLGFTLVKTVLQPAQEAPEEAKPKPTRTASARRAPSRTAAASAASAEPVAEAMEAPPPAPASLDLAAPVSRGTALLVSRDDFRAAITDVFRSHQGEIQQCYDHASTTDATFGGRWSVQVKVQTSGRIGEVHVTSGSGATNATFSDCMVQAVSRWSLRGHLSEERSLTFPISFN